MGSVLRFCEKMGEVRKQICESGAINIIRKLEGEITSNRYRARSKVDAGVGFGSHFRWFDDGVDRMVAGSAITDSHANPADIVLAIKGIADRQMKRLDGS